MTDFSVRSEVSRITQVTHWGWNAPFNHSKTADLKGPFFFLTVQSRSPAGCLWRSQLRHKQRWVHASVLVKPEVGLH